jgi:hypothetical protein
MACPRVVGFFVYVVQIRVGDVRMILLYGVPIHVGDVRVILGCCCDGQIHVVGCFLMMMFVMMFF